MFTGCIDHCGHLRKIEPLTTGRRFYIASQFHDVTVGESIAVDGVCLTVTHVYPDEFSADVSPETLNLTHFSALQTGALVNLERSLRLSDRLHGHFVTGHIDQTAVLAWKKPYAEFVAYGFSGVAPMGTGFLVTKGSVAVNGVSLTVNLVSDHGFDVMLIPETLTRTNLAALQCGDRVNIEYDYLAKLLAKQLQLSTTNQI